MKINKLLLNTLLAILFSAFVLKMLSAQRSQISPYSQFGLGKPIDLEFADQYSMGGMKYSLGNENHLNPSNPATYVYGDQPRFDVGIFSQHTLAVTEESKKNINNTNFRDMTLRLPIADKIGMAVGIIPFNRVGYKITETNNNSSINDQITKKKEGKGGFNRLFMGTAYSLIKNDTTTISLGVNASYIFGKIEKFKTTILNEDFFNTRQNQQLNANDFIFESGIHFKHRLRKSTEKNQYHWIDLNIGLTGQLGRDIKTKQHLLTRTFVKNNIGNEKLKDTITNEVNNKSITLPMKIGGGVNINMWDKFLVGVDFNYENWSDLSFNFNNNLNTTKNIENSYEIRTGFQYTPSPRTEGSFFESVKYRAGLHYKKTSLSINNESINNYGISFGLGLPIMRINSKTFFNLGARLSKNGTTSNGLIREMNANIFFGFSFSPHARFKWFQQKKYR
ncbi:MAG: hypothetical protein ABEH43_01495 [Flavobacteriales bacterium]